MHVFLDERDKELIDGQICELTNNVSELKGDIVNYEQNSKLNDGSGRSMPLSDFVLYDNKYMFISGDNCRYVDGDGDVKCTRFIPINIIDKIATVATPGVIPSVCYFADEDIDSYISNETFDDELVEVGHFSWFYGKRTLTPPSNAKYCAVNMYVAHSEYELSIKGQTRKENIVFRVGSARNGDFTFNTFKDVTEHIYNKNIVGATVIFDAEIFDLASEYGQEYLDNVPIPTGNPNAIGPKLGNDTVFKFPSGSKITFDYNGNNAAIYHYFSPINVYGSFKLINANIEVENCRYCVHEDLPTSSNSIPNNYTVEYIDCYMRHKGNSNVGGGGIPICIGAGVNKNGCSIINGGRYISDSYQYDISYHNCDSSFGGNGAKVSIKNVYCEKGIVAVRDFVQNQKTAYVEIVNCFVGNGINEEVMSATYNDVDIVQWNNVKR